MSLVTDDVKLTYSCCFVEARAVASARCVGLKISCPGVLQPTEKIQSTFLSCSTFSGWVNRFLQSTISHIYIRNGHNDTEQTSLSACTHSINHVASGKRTFSAPLGVYFMYRRPCTIQDSVLVYRFSVNRWYSRWEGDTCERWFACVNITPQLNNSQLTPIRKCRNV